MTEQHARKEAEKMVHEWIGHCSGATEYTVRDKWRLVDLVTTGILSAYQRGREEVLREAEGILRKIRDN